MKIKGFTILEMIVALAIAATVLSISYYAFISVSLAVDNQQKEFSRIESLHKISFLLSNDLNGKEEWSWSENNKLTNGILSYQFNKSSIVRAIEESEQVFYFDEISIDKYFYSNSDYISQLKIKLKLGQQQFDFSYSLNEQAEIKVNRKGIGNRH
ncbi:MAG: hypothetical protein CMC96_07765 [Flavobacteriales bacterium]|nr:hypothetical protein [Flavobacteriales bacterium]|tara:strand:+ start:2565 stop:3029 length:465 start_codon:yes stop_codon:yes gene_type:complete